MKLPFPRTWWIDPGKVIGGRYPGTPDPVKSRRLLKLLLKAGVRVIVNLQEADECGVGEHPFPDYKPVVAELAAELGVKVQCLRFPIPDCVAPSIEKMATIQKAIQKAVEAGLLVYVHCWGGHGRTGCVAGCWLVSNGYDPEQALKLMKRRRTHDPHLKLNAAPLTGEQRGAIEHWFECIKLLDRR